MTTLSAQVSATNKNHQYINELVPLVLEWLKPFNGKKIATAQDEIVAAAKKTRPVFNKQGFRWFLRFSGSSLYLVCDTYVSAEGFSSVYSKGGDIFIGKNNGHLEIIENFLNFQPLKTDFSAEIIKNARHEISILEERIKKIRSDYDMFLFENAY